MAKTLLRELTVAGVNWHGVDLKLEGRERSRITWSDLRAAAEQDDPTLRVIYRSVLDGALAMARDRKMLSVAVKNLGGSVQDLGARTWAAVLRNPDGSPAPSHMAGAEWGQTGTKAQALEDAERARAKFVARGWDVSFDAR